MKTIKRILVLALVVIMMMSVMVMPASALGNGWPEKISKFQEVAEYNDSEYPGYVKVAQRFFFCYSETKDEMGSSTVDGDFGPSTFAALRRFRSVKGLSNNDLMDSDAWKAMAKELDGEGKYENPTRSILRENGGNVMLVHTGTSQYCYHYYIAQNSVNIDEAFHVD